MSDTVKIIVELPKSALKLLNTTGVDWLDAAHILSAVAHGIPLDDVKAEIVTAYDEVTLYSCDEQVSCFASKVTTILDNIGKAESEDKE